MEEVIHDPVELTEDQEIRFRALALVTHTYAGADVPTQLRRADWYASYIRTGDREEPE